MSSHCALCSPSEMALAPNQGLVDMQLTDTIDNVLDVIELTDLLTLNPVQKLFRVTGCLPMVSAKYEYHRLYSTSILCYESRGKKTSKPPSLAIEV